jgi:hypothetical protein
VRWEEEMILLRILGVVLIGVGGIVASTYIFWMINSKSNLGFIGGIFLLILLVALVIGGIRKCVT